MKPVRLQLSRRRGFDLQALSLAINGLPAVNVARPSKWGNPWRVVDCGKYGWLVQDTVRNWYPSSEAVAFRFAVTKYRRWLRTSEFARRHIDLDSLQGKNLACWCAHDSQFCHADVLLELANPSEGL